jgi:hypothetical protein
MALLIYEENMSPDTDNGILGINLSNDIFSINKKLWKELLTPTFHQILPFTQRG